MLKILLIGDVVGAPGRNMVTRVLPRLIAREGIHFVICNAENAAGGSGLTKSTYEEICDAGVDAITLGDHAYRKDEIHALFETKANLCRPANFPPAAPGAQWLVLPARDGTPVGVFSLIGRVFLKPVDCPLLAADRILDELKGRAQVVVCDLHAEATSEKQLIGRYLDGRVSAVLGTHTHVATADEQIFPGGTAYQTDVGMTGPYDSVIGRRYDRVLATTLSGVPEHLDVASGDPRLCGTLVEVNPADGRAVAVTRISIDLQASQSLVSIPGRSQ